MLVLRNAITRPYWTAMHEYMLNRLRYCVSVRVKGPVWRLDSGRNRKIYFICDNDGWPVSWLYLTRRKGWKAWEVAQVWTFPEYRGQGHAELLYKAAINTDRLLLASGNMHTQFSQALWRRFVRKKLFNIWAQDFKHLERTSTVEVDEDELVCQLPIYLAPSSWMRHTTDTRLLALKKD